MLAVRLVFGSFGGRLLGRYLAENLLHLVLQDFSVLFDEHALLHLGEDVGLILTEGVLTLVQRLHCHVVGEALAWLARSSGRLTRHTAPLPILQQGRQQRTIAGLFFGTFGKREYVAGYFKKKLLRLLG